MSNKKLPDPFYSALLVQNFLQSKGWDFCFIGGLVVSRWGRVRATEDIDLTLFTGFSSERTYIDSLLKEFSPRREDALEFALQYRVLLLKSPTNVGIDIALGGFDFEKNAIKRASLYEFFPGISLKTCSAEDLIVHKSFAGRGTDWDDVKSIIIRNFNTLNKKLIFEELTPLLALKETPEEISKLELLLDKYGVK